MLDFNGDGVYKLVWSRYPVDCTDNICITWELELPREGGLDTDFTPFNIGRKSIFWDVQLEAVLHPLKALGLTRVGEGSVVDYINTT